MQLQGQKGGPQLQDLLTFFVYRCYCAQSETVIPWAGLRDQFPQDDSNPRRFKQNVKKAIQQLRILWPEIRIDVVPEGVWVDRAVHPFYLMIPARSASEGLIRSRIEHWSRTFWVHLVELCASLAPLFSDLPRTECG